MSDAALCHAVSKLEGWLWNPFWQLWCFQLFHHGTSFFHRHCGQRLLTSKKNTSEAYAFFSLFSVFFYQISWQLRSSLIVFKAGNLRYLTSKDYQLESYKWLLALFQSKWKMSIGNTYRWMFLTFEFFLTQLLLLISFPFLFIANTWRVSVF